MSATLPAAGPTFTLICSMTYGVSSTTKVAGRCHAVTTPTLSPNSMPPFAKLNIFELVPVRLLHRRREVQLAVEGAEVEPRMDDVELGGVILGHGFQDADTTAGIHERNCTTGGINGGGLPVALAGVVPQMHGAIGLVSYNAVALHHFTDCEVVIFIDAVAVDERVNAEHVNFLRQQ